MEVFSEMVELLASLSTKAKTLDEVSVAMLAKHIMVELLIDNKKQLHIAETDLYSCLRVLNGEASGARTQDLLLKRELLYQLS